MCKIKTIYLFYTLYWHNYTLLRKNAKRVLKYKKYLNTLKYDGIEMSISVGDIDRFEKLKNVYAYEEGLSISKKNK